jgi:hypothetical protein
VKPRPPRRAKAPIAREKHEQAAGVGLLRWLKCAVYVTGTSRPKGDFPGTCMTPGLPDVICLLPGTSGVLFWEVKSRAGRPRPEQDAFRSIVAGYEAAGLPIYHCLGPYDALRLKLVTIGLLRPDQVPHYALPASAVSVAVASNACAKQEAPTSTTPPLRRGLHVRQS